MQIICYTILQGYHQHSMLANSIWRDTVTDENLSALDPTSNRDLKSCSSLDHISRSAIGW